MNLARLPEQLGPLYAELAARRGPPRVVSATTAAAVPIGDMLERLAGAASGDRRRLLSAFLSEQVVKVLALNSAHVDPHQSLLELGLDSLMAMELRNRIQAALKVKVAVADLLKGPTIHTLSGELLDVVVSGGPRAAAPAEEWEEGSL